jgi:hypothetical protein
MFKRKSVNWRKLSHAYGPARDVPQLLKALTSEEAATRSQALDKLNASLCHQGTVYSATVASVPLFIELLQTPNIQDKNEILILLGCFARGSDEEELEEFLPTVQKAAYNSIFPALLDGLSLYLQLLNDPDAKIRAASSYLLTCFAEAEPTIVENLCRALFVEADPLAQASFILNLPKGAAQRPDIHASLLETVKQEQKLIVQLAAAMELAIDLHQDMPLEAVVVLLDVVMESKPLAVPYNELTANLNDIVSDVADCLCLAGRKYRQQSLPVLIQALDKNRAFAALKIAHALLSLTFGPNNSLFKGERTTEQEAALQAIAGSQRAWRYNINMAEILRSFGLPDHPVALQAYLEGRDPLQAMMDLNS